MREEGRADHRGLSSRRQFLLLLPGVLFFLSLVTHTDTPRQDRMRKKRVVKAVPVARVPVSDKQEKKKMGKTPKAVVMVHVAILFATQGVLACCI